MENKEIFRKKLGYKIIDVKLDNTKTDLDVIFIGDNNYTLELSYYHEDDCCEKVYADFSVIEYYIKDIIKFGIINEIIIKTVEDTGFIICFNGKEYKRPLKIFIPCYDEQNGYYSSKLELIIKSGNISIDKIDISSCSDFIYND